MANSKIDYFGETLMDLTEDTVTEETLEEGVTAHGADGEKVVGTGLPGRVRYDKTQSLTEEQKQQARKNTNSAEDSSALKYTIADDVAEVGSVTVIEETGASVSGADNSVYFTEKYLLVQDGAYKLNKDAMLSLVNKKLTGNGSVVWNGWQNLGTYIGNNMLNGVLKVRYANDPVYMSMKLPSEAVNTIQSTRLNGSILYYQPSGLNRLVNIGSIYAVDATALPDTFTVCIGKMSMYTLSNEKNAKWKLYEQHIYPTDFALYDLPWSSSGDSHSSVDASKITKCDNYIKFELSKTDIATKCLHFHTANSVEFDGTNCKAIVCMYEIWTETESVDGKIYGAIGADQKNTEEIQQAFSGRNCLIGTQKRVVIGHNISDALYDELHGSINDPVNLFYDFNKVDEKWLDEQKKQQNLQDIANKVNEHNESVSAHQDIRSEVSTVKEMFYGFTVESVDAINLSDEIYDSGAFSNNGSSDWSDSGAFRTRNYLPVIGGKAIEVIYGNNKFSFGSSINIVQFDSEKNCIVEKTTVRAKKLAGTDAPSNYSPLTLTLHENTAYIRFYIYGSYETLEGIQITVTYVDNFVNEYTPRSTTERSITGGKVLLRSPNGNFYKLMVNDEGVLSAVRV